MTKKWIDLTQPFYDGMRPANPTSIMGAVRVKTIRELDESKAHPHIQELTVYSHQGTHVDAPAHVVRGGQTIDELPLERFAGTGVVLEILRDGSEPITAADLERATPEVQRGDIVFIHTGWDPGNESAPGAGPTYLSEDAARWLVDRGVAMLGVDVTTVDIPPVRRKPGFNYPIHMELLSHGVLVAENIVNLGAIAGRRVTIQAFPIKFQGGDGAPARIVALVE